MQPQDDHPTPAKPRRSLGRRVLRALAWTLCGLVVLIAALGAGAWWWVGSDQSLAYALAKAARYMPAGQTLQSRDVSGSLRTGGRIGYLQWQSPTLSVEVYDAAIGWTLKPLFQRKVQLGEVQAKEVLIERRGPAPETSEPLQPLEQLVLPVDVDLPFRIGTVRWAGPPVVEAKNLAGHYTYTQRKHALNVDGVDLADGHYSARVGLQGDTPMALDLALEGRVRAPLPEGRSIDVLANATAKGTLAGTAARLAVTADLKPAEQDATNPMQAQLRANIAPWQTQPVVDANADLRNVDLARLWPTAPVTLLTGQVQAGPGASGTDVQWQASADIRNALPGPWDQGKLPVERVEARTTFDGTTWRVPGATVRTGGGRIDAEGDWSPAPLPWAVRATVRNVQPGALHTQLAGAPVGGKANVEQRDDALRFDVALQAQGSAGSAALQGIRLDRVIAQGQWKDQVLDLRTLRVEAAQASVAGTLQARVAERAGSGDLKIVLPGQRAGQRPHRAGAGPRPDQRADRQRRHAAALAREAARALQGFCRRQRRRHGAPRCPLGRRLGGRAATPAERSDARTARRRRADAASHADRAAPRPATACRANARRQRAAASLAARATPRTARRVVRQPGAGHAVRAGRRHAWHAENDARHPRQRCARGRGPLACGTG